MADIHSEPKAVANAGGVVATACVLCLYLFVVHIWGVGFYGNALLGVAAAGILFRTPYTVAIWAALTLLVLTAVATGARSVTIAENFGNFAYYGLVVGCFWAIWAMVAERFHWSMPATILFERVERSMDYRSVPLFLVIVTIVTAIIFATIIGVIAPARSLLALIAIIGLFWRPKYRFISFCGATLAILAGYQFYEGNVSWAIQTILLGCGTIMTASTWFARQGLLTRSSRHRSRRVSVVTNTVDSQDAEKHQQDSESEQIVADV